MRLLTKGYLQGFETKAGAATLWRALVEPECLALWYGDHAIVEPRVGGRYFAVSRLFGRREAFIERFEPGVRLQLIFEPSPQWPPLTEGALVEDLLIDEHKGRRMIRVMGSGIPSNPDWTPVLKQLKSGWALAFGLLQTRLRNGEIKDFAA
ncbi:MAG: SRPBCC domain-containing protein [Steroidobacteraceae bacterium]